MVTAADAPSIYDIPKVLHREGLDAYVVRRLGLPFRDVDWTAWDDLLRRVHHPTEEVTVGLVGKYIDLPDAYLSVAEALRAGGFAHEAKVNIRWIPSDECETPAGAARHLSDVDAICVPGGFGIRGIEGKLGALTYARTHGIPTLGLCLGLQCMVIEYARNVAGLEKADSTEFDPDSPEPVIATMEEQKSFVEGAGDLGGTMRLGLYPAALADGSVVREAYGERPIEERHRHRYEVNNPTATSSRPPAWCSRAPTPDHNLVEFVELPREVHPYYVVHPGAPRAALAADPPAPAVRGAGRRRDRAAAGAAVPDRRDRPAPARRPSRRAATADVVASRRPGSRSRRRVEHPVGAASARDRAGSVPDARCVRRPRGRRPPGPVEARRRRRWRNIVRTRPSAASIPPPARRHLVEVAVGPGQQQVVLDRTPEAARPSSPQRRARRAPRACRRPAPRPRPWRPRRAGAAVTPQRADPGVRVGVALHERRRPPPRRTARARLGGPAPATRGRRRRPPRRRAASKCSGVGRGRGQRAQRRGAVLRVARPAPAAASASRASWRGM